MSTDGGMPTSTEDKGSDEGSLAGLALAAASAVAFGTVAPLAKVGYDHGAGLFPLLAVRFSVAAALLFAFHGITRRALSVPRRTLIRLVALGALGYGIEASLFFAALERAPAGVVTLVFYSYPLITTVLTFALGLERIRPTTVIALGLGSAGVATIFSISEVALAGMVLALAAATAVSLYFVATGVLMKGIDPGVGATWTAVGAALATTIAWSVSGQEMPTGSIPAGIWLGIATAIAFLALYGAIALIGPARTTVAQMLEPVVTVAIAAAFLDERITGRVAIGTTLIVSSLPILASLGHKRPAPPAADTI